MKIFSKNLIHKLRKAEFEVFSIKENHKGISDRSIIDLVKEKNGILITEDKDFGEWVFSNGIKGLTVILLRYKNVKEYEVMEENVVRLVGKIADDTGHKFITISHNKIRIREI